MSRSRRSRLSLLTCAGALLALPLAGCSGSDASAPSTPAADIAPVASEPAVQADAELAAQVPAAIKDKGSLSIATDPTYPPMSFGDGPQGVDADLARAAARTLGLEAEFTTVPFASIRDNVAKGEQDLGWSYTTVTSERMKQVDFVTYYRAGQAWIVKQGSKFSPDDLCGTTSAVIDGFIYVEQIKQISEDSCVSQSKKPANVSIVAGATEGVAMVLDGRADAFPVDSPVAASEIARSNGRLAQAGETLDIAPLGVSVQKGSELGPLVQKAIQHLIDSGAYEQILNRWQVPQGAVDDSLLATN